MPAGVSEGHARVHHDAFDAFARLDPARVIRPMSIRQALVAPVRRGCENEQAARSQRAPPNPSRLRPAGDQQPRDELPPRRTRRGRDVEVAQGTIGVSPHFLRF